MTGGIRRPLRPRLTGAVAALALAAGAVFATGTGCDIGNSVVRRTNSALRQPSKTPAPASEATKPPSGSGSSSGSGKLDAEGSGATSGAATPGPEATPTPEATPLPPPTPSSDASGSDPVPTPRTTATPLITPTPAPTPAFRQIDFEPAEFLNLYVPAPAGVTETAGLPATAALAVLDRQTRARLDAGLFRWTSSDPAIVTVSAGGLVQALSASATLAEIKATALHNPSISVSTFVRVRDRGSVEIEIELPSQ